MRVILGRENIRARALPLIRWQNRLPDGFHQLLLCRRDVRLQLGKLRLLGFPGGKQRSPLLPDGFHGRAPGFIVVLRVGFDFQPAPLELFDQVGACALGDNRAGELLQLHRAPGLGFKVFGWQIA